MSDNGHKDATKFKEYDLTNIDNYEGDYELPWANKIEKIYEVPGVNDMAGVFTRGIFKNERTLNAHLKLMYRHKKFGLEDLQELLRTKVAGTAAIGGVRALEALFAAVNLIAPDMYRTARGMPKSKGNKEEKVVRGSDFRQFDRPQDEVPH